MGSESFSPGYMAAMKVGFDLARQGGQTPGPVHFLAGIAQGDGPAAGALRQLGAGSLVEAASDVSMPTKGPMSLHMQAQGAARDWAERLGEQVAPEHLLVALLDQGSTDVVEALNAAQVDATVVRRTVLRALGQPEDMPAIHLPALSPSATFDRPAMPVSELPVEAWARLRWRQEHLPLDRLRRLSDWHGLYHLERRAAWRIASQAGVDDDTRNSLLHHHNEAVERLATAAAPDVVPAPVEHHSSPTAVMIHRKEIPYWRRIRPRALNVFVGWGTWFKNRAVNLNAAWFKYTTLHHYRGRPRIARPR